VSSRFAQRIRHAGGMAKGRRTPGRCEAAGTRQADGETRRVETESVI
jgi:hypothetical protein